MPDHELVLGKHSGRHALGARLAGLGYGLDREQMERAYGHFIALADQRKTVDEGDLHAIARQATGWAAAAS